MVCGRVKLTTRGGGSVFKHLLATEEESAEEVVHEYNFRSWKFIYHTDTSLVAHVVMNGCYPSDLLFPVFYDFFMLPYAGNVAEEMIMGIEHPDRYIDLTDFQYFSLEDLLQGRHLYLRPNLSSSPESADEEMYDSY